MVLLDQSHKLFDKLYPNSFSPYLLKKIDYIFGAFVFSVSLIMYFITLNPSVTAGDSGELITTVYNMGASHPPGFPLYGIIGKLFTFLRFSDIGYKMNIFSAMSAATAVLFAYFTIAKLVGFNKDTQSDSNSLFGTFNPSIHIPAVAAALMFAFSKAHWSQAIMAEVYALNAMLSSIMFFVMVVWYEEVMYYRNEEDNLWLAPRITLLLAYVMGLSITNHQIPVWYIIAWGLMLFPIMYLLVSFKGKEFINQFNDRKQILMFLAAIVIVAMTLLFISAIKPYMLFPELMRGTKYRLIFADHVPYILTAILCVPVWLSVYIAQNYLYKLQRYSSYNKTILDVGQAVILAVVVAIVAWLFFRLTIGMALFTSLPLLLMYGYQLSQHKQLHARTQNNWVDYFLFILTIAMWLLVFAVSLYLYLWIRAKAIAPLVEPKPLTWGDTQTLDILFNHMLRKQYPVGTDDYSNVLGQIGALATYHINQFGIVNVILGIFGVAFFAKRDPVQGTYFILASVIYLWSIIDFINFEVDPRSLETQEVFFIQQFLVYAFFIAFAYQKMIDLTTNYAQKRGEK